MVIVLARFRPPAKFFLKAPSAPIYTKLEGECAPKKLNFLVKIFQKVLKNAFFGLFFQNFTAARKIWPKQGSFDALVPWESWENQFDWPKKRSTRFYIFFVPRENRRSATGQFNINLQNSQKLKVFFDKTSWLEDTIVSIKRSEQQNAFFFLFYKRCWFFKALSLGNVRKFIKDYFHAEFRALKQILSLYNIFDWYNFKLVFQIFYIKSTPIITFIYKMTFLLVHNFLSWCSYSEIFFLLDLSPIIR